VRLTNELIGLASSSRHKCGFIHRLNRFGTTDAMSGNVIFVPIVPDEIAKIDQNELLVYDNVIHEHGNGKSCIFIRRKYTFFYRWVYDRLLALFWDEGDLEEGGPILAGDKETAGRVVVGDAVQHVRRGTAIRLGQ
jgi:hypothetical protein